MKTTDFNKKAPYYFKDLTIALTSKGDLRQSKKLIKLIKKEYSTKVIMSGIPCYYVRVDSFQFKHSDPCVLVAKPDFKGGFIVKYLED